MGNFTYKECLFNHSWERAKDRYNLFINKNEYYDLNNRIKNKKFNKNLIFLTEKKNRERKNTIYCVVNLKNTWALVCYNTQQSSVSSFLPFGNLERYYKYLTNSTIALLKTKGLLVSDEEWLNNKINGK